MGTIYTCPKCGCSFRNSGTCPSCNEPLEAELAPDYLEGIAIPNDEEDEEK